MVKLIGIYVEIQPYFDNMPKSLKIVTVCLCFEFGKGLKNGTR